MNDSVFSPARSASRSPLAWIALAALSLVSLDVAAQPLVHVRAESRIELRTVRREDGTEIQGTLRDDLGGPLGARALEVRIRRTVPDAVPRVESVTTDPQGRFGLSLRLELGSYVLSAAFEGDESHERVEVERQLDLTRADVRLRVVVPDGGRLDLDRPTHTIEVFALSAQGGSGLTVDVLDERDRAIARGVTDATGRVRFDLRSSDLGAPGAGRLKARSRPDALRSEAQTEVPIVRLRATSITLQAARGYAQPGEGIRLSGELRDSSGPIEGAAVGVFAGEEHLATVLTDSAGAFATEVHAPARANERLSVEARFVSDSPGRAPSQSAPVTIEIRNAPSAPWAWSFVPIAISILVLAWIARRTPARIEKAAPPPVPKAAGIEAAARRASRPDRADVTGSIVDQRDDEAIGEVAIHVVQDGRAVVTLTADDDGSFAIRGLAEGSFVLTFEARGYAPLACKVEVPHRGEWTGMTVRLQSLRALALEPFRGVALAILPSSRLWDVWTNRDVLAHAKPRDAHALGALTERVEEAYYASDPPDERDVAEIEHQATGVLADLRRARAPEAPKG